MQITIDAHLAVQKIDGIARYLVGLLSELPVIDKTIQYTILDLPRSKSALPDHVFAHANVRRIELDMMGPSPRQHLVMRRLLKESGATLYHHPQYNLPIGVDIPSVITIHDLKYIFHPEYLARKSRLKQLYIKQSLQYSIYRCNAIITVSEHTKRDLITSFGIRDEKIDVIHHGVTRVENPPPLNGSLGQNLPARFILFVGTRRPHKNIEGLVRMLKILRNEKKIDVDLVVAGKGYADYRAPEKLANELSMQAHTHFVDFVPEDMLPSLYASASLVALPSFYEGFGLPALEAMAAGRPVLGSRLTSLPEVIGDGGLLIDPNDPADMAEKAARILQDGRLASELGKKALQRARNFSWQSMAEATLSVYLKASKGSTG